MIMYAIVAKRSKNWELVGYISSILASGIIMEYYEEKGIECDIHQVQR